MENYAKYEGQSYGIIYDITARTGNSKYYHAKFKVNDRFYEIKNTKSMLAQLGDTIPVRFDLSDPNLAYFDIYNEKEGVIDGIFNLLLIDLSVMFFTSILLFLNIYCPDRFEFIINLFSSNHRI